MSSFPLTNSIIFQDGYIKPPSRNGVSWKHQEVFVASNFIVIGRRDGDGYIYDIL
jgi:hypothetical protein